MPAAATAAELPRLDTAPWLVEPATQAVLACIAAGGHEARVVGGAVRNALLGIPVTDIDIATTARPETVVALAAASGFRVLPTGLQHGTVTVIVDRHPFEVTTLRVDVESHGRHATVAFTDDWSADAARRDFTINAMYCGADGSVHDTVGGYQDLRLRRVRFINDPTVRIREDYLRILRFFRFFATYATGVPDREALAAATRERAGLARLSAERIRAELLKLLAAPRALDAVASMAEAGVLTEVLPVAPRRNTLARLAAIEAALGRPPDPVLRLAALTVASCEDAPRLSARLRLSGEEAARLALAGQAAEEPLAFDDRTAARRRLYRVGAAGFADLVLLNWAAQAVAEDSIEARALLSLAVPAAVPVLPVSGRDLLARGVAAGPRVGEVLRALETWWIAHDFPTDPARIAGEVDRLIAD
jgi:tRNA nucleotidyltransferase/poly(A) polymerase